MRLIRRVLGFRGELEGRREGGFVVFIFSESADEVTW